MNIFRIFLGVVISCAIVTLALVQYSHLYPDSPRPVQGGFNVSSRNIYYFEGVRGPTSTTVIPTPSPTHYSKYSSGTTSRLAVLLTNPNSEWLGIAHGLKSIGIPFLITTDYRQALQHKTIYVYPELSDQVLPAAAVKALLNFPKQGGTLIAGGIIAPNANQLFGFSKTEPTSGAFALSFTSNLPTTSDFVEPEEQTIKIGNQYARNSGLYNYQGFTGTPIATYQDGTAAILETSYAHGKAYALGLDLGHFLLLGYNNKQEFIAKTYVNSFEPSIDVLLRTLKNIYLQSQPDDGVTLATVPNGKSLSVISSHDLDYAESVKNAPDYAELEKQHGRTGTYFMETKYVTDWNDRSFFDSSAVTIMQKLKTLGMEVGSEAVSHSILFDVFPLGTGKEQYPDYQPFVMDSMTTYNGTLLGEARVSRFLIEHFLPEQDVVSFRAGFLLYPEALPQVLAAVDYRYDSSTTANNSLTHLPFQLDYNRETTTEVPVYEFPVTIEDQLPPRMLDRLPQALDLAKKLSRYGGLFVVLYHPDILGQKLEFEDKFLDAIDQVAPVWHGNLGEFGAWWSARDQVGVDVVNDKTTLTILLNAPIAISGLTLQIPANLHYTASMPADLTVTQNGQQVVIDHILGSVKLIFKKG